MDIEVQLSNIHVILPEFASADRCVSLSVWGVFVCSEDMHLSSTYAHVYWDPHPIVL